LYEDNQVHYAVLSYGRYVIFKKKTRCSAIAERPRCRVRYSFGQKWKTGTGRQYFTDITVYFS